MPHTPAYGLASKIASKLTEDLVVDATDEDLSGVTFQLDELSDDSLLEISRLLEIDPPPSEQVDFDDEADTILRSTPPVVTRACMRRFGTPTPTPTPV